MTTQVPESLKTEEPSFEKKDYTGEKISNHSNVQVKNSYASELETAALQQMAYDSNFTEDISVKMRIPEKLVVARDPEENFQSESTYNHNMKFANGAAYSMEVPDRIVVSVGEQGVKYGRSSDTMFNNEFSEMNADDPLTLATPPRKLTLAERNLDSLDIEDRSVQASPTHIRSLTDVKSDDSSLSSVLLDPAVSSLHNDSVEELDDVTMLRRQVFKLHRRVTKMEKRDAERSKREVYLYASTVMMWVIGGWILYSNRRPY